MGGLLSALFSSGAIGGSSAKRDRSEVLDAYGDLGNVFNFALPAGKAAFTTGQQGYQAGQGDLSTASGYLKQLTTGGPASTNAAIAPERAQVLSANDAAKRQLAASGTARGGGTAGVNQARDAATQGKIDEALFGLRPAAAGELAKVGSAEGQLGLGETGLGLESAATAGKTATALGDLAAEERGQSTKIHQDAVNDIAGGIENVLGDILSGSSLSDITKGVFG
jgi:hypothetical protein